MGKIRVKTIGEEAEKEEKAEKKEPEIKVQETAKAEVKPEKKAKKAQKSHRSKKYEQKLTEVDRTKTYSLSEALTLLPSLKLSKFDETVELHLNTNSQGISGQMKLPHGSGKEIRVAIADNKLIEEIEKGKLEFDILLANPSMMPKLARVAKVLGPRGLMPNPKSGTITDKPEETAKKYQGGVMNFRTEAKSPIIHLTVGKLSFGEEKLGQNIKAAIEAVKKENIRNATLKSTMSPGIKLQV